MIKTLTKTLLAAGMIAASSIAASAADYTIRATANSNENDEDYDGLVVFKNYVEAASNGAIEVELFIGTQLCATGAECIEGVAEGLDGRGNIQVRLRDGTLRTFAGGEVSVRAK